MNVTDAMAERALRFHRGGDSAVSRAPRDNKQIAVGIASGNDVRDILDDGFDFCGANANHVFVVQRFIVDVAGDVLFFEPADAVFEAGRARNGPWTRESVRIATIGLK